MDLTLWGLVPMLFGGATEPFDNPTALVGAIYAPLVAGEQIKDIEQFYSTRLQSLVAENISRSVVDAKGEPIDPDAPAIMAFNPFLDDTENSLRNLAVSEPTVSGDYAVATVSFTNEGEESLLSIAMVKQPDGWHVDDVASLGGDDQWLLSWLLQYDPYSEQ